ncbi:MAG: S1C family serine protease [Phycisphaerae bacterium]
MQVGKASRWGIHIVFACAGALVLSPTASAAAVGGLPPRYQLADLRALEQAFTNLAAEVQPSAVSIRTYRTPQSTGRRILLPLSHGSGFVIDPDGYIATNRHVLEEADRIAVILHNGMRYDATVQQTDMRSDLAVIKIDASQLKPVRFETKAPKVGQWVFACGNPFGLANEDGHASVTFGSISALGRRMTERLAVDGDLQYYGNMIEASATINPGNSGGGLFNIDGEVIGIVTAIETSSGVSEGHGFAIPIDKNIRRILETLKRGEEVRYGFLGVKVQDPPPVKSAMVVDSRSVRGALVDDVTLPDGPAARAGLRSRDVVIEYDGTAIKDSDHLVRLVGFTPVGTSVSITYLRHGVKRTTTVTVADRRTSLPLTRRTP